MRTKPVPWRRRDLLALLAALPIVLRGAAAAAQVTTGQVSLPDDAVAYVPAGIGANPPVLILLHGAGQTADELIPRFRAAADAHGFVLLGPKSAEETWDLVHAMRLAQQLAAAPSASRVHAAWPPVGRDGGRVEGALTALAARLPIDRRRIALAGFSDGASLALSLGPRRPDLYRAVLAFSPGFLVLPPTAPGRQPIFISHGRQDQVLPYAYCDTYIVPSLRQRGFHVDFHSFDGRHQVTDEIADQAVTFFLASMAGPTRR